MFRAPGVDPNLELSNGYKQNIIYLNFLDIFVLSNLKLIKDIYFVFFLEHLIVKLLLRPKC